MKTYILHDRLLAKGIPVVSIVTPDEKDLSTRRIVFGEGATPEQIAEANADLKTFEPPKRVTSEDVLEMLVKEGVITKEKADAARAQNK